MIEINLIPDVKLSLLKARKQRTLVTSIAVLVSLAAGGVVVLLAVYVFGAQSVLQLQADGAIKDEYQKLSQVKDLPQTLTVQSQLSEIDSLHSEKIISSRIFDVLSTVVPTGKNRVVINKLAMNSEDGTVTVDATAENGYEALEVFKKTLAQTKFEFKENGETRSVDLASSITDGERQSGEDVNGKRGLNFSISFTYAPELFSANAKNGRVVAPQKQNATDSATGVPSSLFGGKEGTQ